ncbi:lipoprotein LpqH [Mycobacterium botniense]|uniref:Lipoprotein LppE n=1 Tax=Mycobacterium botniense TaxID=84962 RepID=A0A7I9XZE1_9MYCO|nr:lipoprotein LpqH [Mycobacterium botniense]GFG75159.1 hypothetical protein MBOT_25240 [Mycobacterium botniense]
MSQRFCAMVLTALVLATASAACSGHTVPQKTARITVDNNTRTSQAVSCTQLQWLLTMDISATPAHVRAVLNLQADKPKPESVNIDNFNGFSGIADSGAGSAQAAFAHDTYTITGAAQQTNPDNPNTPTTATFRIEAKC